jgi:hypothetical protein
MSEKFSSPASNSNGISQRFIDQVKQQIYAELQGNGQFGNSGGSYSPMQGGVNPYMGYGMGSPMGMGMMMPFGMQMMPFYGFQMGMSPQMGNYRGNMSGIPKMDAFGGGMSFDNGSDVSNMEYSELKQYVMAILDKYGLRDKISTSSKKRVPRSKLKSTYSDDKLPIETVATVSTSENLCQGGFISEEPLYEELKNQNKLGKLSGDPIKDLNKIFKKSYSYLKSTDALYRDAVRWRSPIKKQRRAVLWFATQFEYFNKRAITEREYDSIVRRIETGSLRNANYAPNKKKKRGFVGRFVGSTISGISKAKPAVIAGL